MGGGALALMLSGLWIYSLIKRDASIIDVFWPAGFVLLALIALWLAPLPSWAGMAIIALVAIWGIRLGLHLFIRFLRDDAEDPRYIAMRKRHGAQWWWRSFFIVFAFQGVMLWLVALPFGVALALSGDVAAPLGVIIGILIALLGLIIEAAADWQLTAFRARANPGELLTTGFWKYTRHPNYLGDAIFWWGIWLACVAASPEAIWTIFAPLTMNILLVKVSGAALLDKYLRRKTGYAHYAQKTPRFLPRFW